MEGGPRGKLLFLLLWKQRIEGGRRGGGEERWVVVWLRVSGQRKRSVFVALSLVELKPVKVEKQSEGWRAWRMMIVSERSDVDSITCVNLLRC